MDDEGGKQRALQAIILALLPGRQAHLLHVCIQAVQAGAQVPVAPALDPEPNADAAVHVVDWETGLAVLLSLTAKGAQYQEPRPEGTDSGLVQAIGGRARRPCLI